MPINKFINFIGRIIKTYKVFPNHNPGIDTEASVGESDLGLAGFFENS